MHSLLDHFENPIDCRNMCVRMVRSDMCTWSGMQPHDRAWAHFSIRSNFQAAWKSAKFQDWWNQPKILQAVPEEEISFDWPIPLGLEKKDYAINTFEGIIQNLNQCLQNKKGISASLQITRKRTQLTLLEWYQVCQLPRDLLASLETNGRCINDKGDLQLLCERFKLPANVFCSNPKQSSEIDDIVELRGLSEYELRQKMTETELPRHKLIALRHYYGFAIDKICRDLHVSLRRYHELESGKLEVTDRVAKHAGELYKLPARYFLLDALN